MEMKADFSDVLDQRLLLQVLDAYRRGDFSARLPAHWIGLAGKIADALNDILQVNRDLAQEIGRVSSAVGREGRLRQRAAVPGASGDWNGMVNAVNALIDDLARPTEEMARVIGAVASGDLTRSVQVPAAGEVAELKDKINEMIRNLKESAQRHAQEDWLKTNLARLTRVLQGQHELEGVTRLILAELAPLVSAQHGAFYLMDPKGRDARLRMVAGYAYRANRNVPLSFLPGEGLVGQCALQKQRILLDQVPPDYVQVSSGLGAAAPACIVVLPILFDQEVKAVIEIASMREFTETHLSFLEQLMESIGVVLNTIEANSRTESLLAQSQSLAQELQQTNLELAEKARLLSQQNQEVERKNREVEQAKRALEEKATQLSLSSRYKSEFLANMSHELRTPLNSLLILSQQLSDNPQGNLTRQQVEFAKAIHGSGSDLLTLINDILDLSKIESGTVRLDLGECRFQILRLYVERTFRHMAEVKHLGFSVQLAEGLPPSMLTDSTRLQQILKNLLSNAFKFTAHGAVTLRIAPVKTGWTPGIASLDQAGVVIAFAVSDSGIGIAADKLQLIFEAFQQADGSTARKYGGTGLGLSISRELARLLHGEIRVESQPEAGSTFTLFLPYGRGILGPGDDAQASLLDWQGGETLPAPAPPAAQESALPLPGELEEPAILIASTDQSLLKALREGARTRSFKDVVCPRSDAVLSLARDIQPIAILLDIDLPHGQGMRLLEQLKYDRHTRHIPVHAISGGKEREACWQAGARSFLSKPVGPELLQQEFIRIQQFMNGEPRLLLALGDPGRRAACAELLRLPGVRQSSVASIQEALAVLEHGHFDCVVLDAALPGVASAETFKALARQERLRAMPLLWYREQGQGGAQAARLQRMTRSGALRQAGSPAELLELATLFLHSPYASLEPEQQDMLVQRQLASCRLEGRQVLIVDDDVRNLFALSSVLERQRMKVLFAENGRDGIEVLERHPETDILLMDIMMPEMDGYDTMRAIRSIGYFAGLPIITLTAKAMKGDREKCIAAGASDYIAKPVDVEHLLEMVRVWLYKGRRNRD